MSAFSERHYFFRLFPFTRGWPAASFAGRFWPVASFSERFWELHCLSPRVGRNRESTRYTTHFRNLHCYAWQGLYDRKSDPEAKVIPEITGTGPLIICRTGFTMLLNNTLYWSNTSIFEELFWTFIHHWYCKCNQFLYWQEYNPRDRNHTPF